MINNNADPIERHLNALVYTYIKNEEYSEAVKALQNEMQSFPRSRAGLSLLAYCYYHMQEFSIAASTYETLVEVCPNIEEYRIYHAQSLFKAGSYAEAFKLVRKFTSSQHSQRLSMLLSSIKYEQDDLLGCKNMLDGCLLDEPETIIAFASLSFKEGNFEDALVKFSEAQDVLGFQPDIAYNIALCHYKLKNYTESSKVLSDVIERTTKDHPELNIGGTKEEGSLRSVGNSMTLQETYLVESFNLRSAIEYDTNEIEKSKHALDSMPYRKEEELDPVTLHNQALICMDDDATTGFRKLNFLLSNPPFPPETFGNLLLLQCKYGYHDLAADILAENSHLTFSFLTENMFEYLNALIMISTTPDESFRKFDVLATKHIENLRKLTKAISDANASRQRDAIKDALNKFDDELDRYIPIIMAQAKIYWDDEKYAMVERLFRQSAEFCGEHNTWKLNVAHVLFMQQGSKFKDAIKYYEPIVEADSKKGMLQIPAIVLANLCVAYIMTNLNEEAEEIMRKIEKEEEAAAKEDKKRQIFHSCIVNLVIGTLYCEKGNFEFGISRICKCLEPYDQKLGPDTWFYTKRCLLALAEKASKHMLFLKDETFHEILNFLDEIDENGRKMSATIGGDTNNTENAGENTISISQEARQLKYIFLRLRE